MLLPSYIAMGIGKIVTFFGFALFLTSFFVYGSNEAFAQTPDTCGFDPVSVVDLFYSDLQFSGTSSEATTILSNPGTVAATLSVQGTDWQDDTLTSVMDVGATKFSFVSGSYSSKTPLSLTFQDIGILQPSVDTDVIWQLRANLINSSFTGPLNQVMTFRVECVSGSFDDWENRKKITIDSTKVAANLNGFPILISITDIDLTKARADGFDFVITKADGTTEVPYEREKWDDATGELVLWFKGDVLDATDVDFYIYYNNPGQSTDKADPTNVWDVNYETVWHMDGIGSTITDSTSNNNDRTLPSSWQWDSAGEISDGVAFTAQTKGGGDQISIGVNEGDDFTLEFWIEGDAAPTSEGYGDSMIIRGAFWNGLAVGNFKNPPSAKIDYTSYGGCCRGPFSTDFGASQADFYTLTLIHDTPSAGTATVKVYKNGAIQQTEELTQKTSGSIRLGSSSSSHYQLGVSIDEFRASKTVRTAGWISTEYNNQNDPDAFVSFGLEELV